MAARGEQRSSERRHDGPQQQHGAQKGAQQQQQQKGDRHDAGQEQEQEDQKEDQRPPKELELISKKLEGQSGIFRKTAQAIGNFQLFYQGVGWRGYSTYTGQRLFEPNMNTRIIRRILQSDRVTAQIRSLARGGSAAGAAGPLPAQASKYLGKSEKEIQDAAKKILEGLVGDLTNRQKLRMMVYAVNNIFIRLYHQGIHVQEEEMNVLKRTALEAEKKGISLFFLPCHKSHIDYMVISYLFYRIGLSLPFIAAGDNLNIPLVGPLLRNCGAFFIRRSFADDPLYSTLFKEYVAVLLSMGYNLEAFIEGTRSRTGKLLNPKFGILKVVVETILSGRAKDVYICPISIGYDKILETESYVNELLGAEKQQESLSGLLNSARVLRLKLGRIDLSFAQPFSLQSFIRDQVTQRPSFDPFKNQGDQQTLLKSLAYRVLMDINKVSVIMPTALVGTSLLTLRGRGIGKEELARKVIWLRKTIAAKGGNVGSFSDAEVPSIIERSVKVLNGVIGERTELLEPVLFVTKRFELSYYRNEVIHIFVEEALVCCALYASLKERGQVLPERKVNKQLVIERVRFLSQTLKLEFIFPPGRVQDNADKIIRELEANGILTTTGPDVQISKRELETGREVFDFYCFLLWPFIETYWLSGVSLFTMSDKGMQIEKVFSSRVQKLATTLYYQGDLSYFESINKETLKNAQQGLLEMGIIERKSIDTTTLICINPAYMENNFQRVRAFIEQIGEFRREGKNRRDTDNTGARTIRLAKMAGANSRL